MLAAQVFFVAFLVPVILAQTKFEKCTTFGSDLCFQTKVKEIVVKIGPVGTNDDVTVTFCSDVDTTQCCTTPVLSSLLSDDWSKNDTETWKAKKFGQCKDKVYKIKRSMLVTVSKSGSGALSVNSIDVYGISPDKKVTELERFQCPKFDIGGKKLAKQTNNCPTGPYHYEEIEKAIFDVGTNRADGTDDDVTVKIASDSNNVTCSQKLSHTLSDDWKYNTKNNVWRRNDFGNCRKSQYKITRAPIFSVSKNGKDDLKVTKSTFYMRRVDTQTTTKYDCGPFEIKGDCKVASLCTQTFNNCKISTVASIGLSSRTTTTKRPRVTTTTKKPKGPGLIDRLLGRGTTTKGTTTTTKTTTTTTATTTTTKKKGLLSSLLG